VPCAPPDRDIDQVLPMPDIRTMLTLIDRLAA